MSVLNVFLWNHICAPQFSLCSSFFPWNKFLLLQTATKVKKCIHKMPWHKAWRGLHGFSKKCSLFILIPSLGKKKPFPSIIEDAYTPRNMGKGANKCCPVDIIVLIRILNTAQWNIGPSLSPDSWYHKQLYPKTDLINVFGLTSKLSLFNCNDFPGRTRVAVRNLIISDLNAFTIFLSLFLLMPTLPFNLKSYFPSLCLPTWYIYRLQS